MHGNAEFVNNYLVNGHKSKLNEKNPKVLNLRKHKKSLKIIFTSLLNNNIITAHAKKANSILWIFRLTNVL